MTSRYQYGIAHTACQGSGKDSPNATSRPTGCLSMILMIQTYWHSIELAHTLICLNKVALPALFHPVLHCVRTGNMRDDELKKFLQ